MEPPEKKLKLDNTGSDNQDVDTVKLLEVNYFIGDQVFKFLRNEAIATVEFEAQPDTSVIETKQVRGWLKAYKEALKKEEKKLRATVAQTILTPLEQILSAIIDAANKGEAVRYIIEMNVETKLGRLEMLILNQLQDLHGTCSSIKEIDAEFKKYHRGTVREDFTEFCMGMRLCWEFRHLSMSDKNDTLFKCRELFLEAITALNDLRLFTATTTQRFSIPNPSSVYFLNYFANSLNVELTQKNVELTQKIEELQVELARLKTPNGNGPDATDRSDEADDSKVEGEQDEAELDLKLQSSDKEDDGWDEEFLKAIEEVDQEESKHMSNLGNEGENEAEALEETEEAGEDQQAAADESSPESEEP